MLTGLNILRNRLSDRPRGLGPLVAVLLVFFPARILWEAYAPGAGFLRVIHFSETDRHRQLPELASLPPQAFVPHDYDGQFYAQIALCPSLQCPPLARVIDNPVYRARRIGQPALAWLLGAGQTRAVLHAFTLINVLAWMGLLLLLARFVGFQRPRDVLLALTLLAGIGTLTSVARALPDLPAAVLSVAAVWTGGPLLLIAGLLAGGALFKETTALSFLAGLPQQRHFRDVFRPWTLIAGVGMVLPLLLWLVYIYAQFPSGTGAGTRNFALPLADVLPALKAAGQDLLRLGRGVAIHRVFYLLSLPSLVVQASYLLLRPRWGDRAWFLGWGFALLLLVLGSNVLADAHAYSRVLLPLTFAFNLLIHRYEQGWRYALWLFLGNIGMTGLGLYLLENQMLALLSLIRG